MRYSVEIDTGKEFYFSLSQIMVRSFTIEIKEPIPTLLRIILEMQFSILNYKLIEIKVAQPKQAIKHNKV